MFLGGGWRFAFPPWRCFEVSIAGGVFGSIWPFFDWYRSRLKMRLTVGNETYQLLQRHRMHDWEDLPYDVFARGYLLATITCRWDTPGADPDDIILDWELPADEPWSRLITAAALSIPQVALFGMASIGTADG
jgi:hypothetical protein